MGTWKRLDPPYGGSVALGLMSIHTASWVLVFSSVKTVTFWEAGIMFCFLCFHAPHNAGSYMVFSSFFVLA